jgi:hypothetical protein
VRRRSPWDAEQSAVIVVNSLSTPTDSPRGRGVRPRGTARTTLRTRARLSFPRCVRAPGRSGLAAAAVRLAGRRGITTPVTRHGAKSPDSGPAPRKRAAAPRRARDLTRSPLLPSLSCCPGRRDLPAGGGLQGQRLLSQRTQSRASGCQGEGMLEQRVMNKLSFAKSFDKVL